VSLFGGMEWTTLLLDSMEYLIAAENGCDQASANGQARVYMPALIMYCQDSMYYI